MMSKAIHELFRNDNVAASDQLGGILGNFPMDGAVLEGGALASLPSIVC